nr:TetR/AcrR family transcriptional regulator [uncultured Sphingosinicella sp.]
METAEQRSDAQHPMVPRIVEAAIGRFTHYGYGKTTVAEIAEDLGVSPAYIYKFFDSKRSICEAVAGETLQRIDEALWDAATAERPATERLRNLYQVILKESVARFFQERKLHDMVVEAVQSDWGAVQRHKQTIHDVARHVLRDGRQAGEFDGSLDEERAVDALWSTIVPFAHPKVLEQTINTDLEARANAVADLVIRGLRPIS